MSAAPQQHTFGGRVHAVRARAAGGDGPRILGTRGLAREPKLRRALAIVPAVAAALFLGACASGDTDPATYVDNTAATLNAHGSAGGDPTTYWFQYGQTTSYGSRTTERSVPSDFSGAVSERVAGLAANTTYHFRVCARNVDGSGCGRDVTFRTGSPSGTSQYPDLITLPPTDLRYDTATISGTTHQVLRFTNTAWNAGQGPLELHGVESSGRTRVYQRVFKSGGGFTDHQIGEFVFHPSHNHWHFEAFAEYGLWTRADYEAWLASGRRQGAAKKVGTKTTFCIIDTGLVRSLPGTPGTARYTSCSQEAQGMSVGWADEYHYSLPEQWIELGTSRLAEGRYVLRSVSDPLNRIYESPSKGGSSRETHLVKEAVTFFRVTSGQIQVEP